VDVLVQSERGDEAAEGDLLNDDPGDQELDVRNPTGVDRAAGTAART
jgi:hypothetical protein